MDSFIIYASQQTASKLDTDAIESPLHSIDAPSPPKISWRQFSPSTIRLAPFPTREYTDDEFQSIVKEVMGVLYVPFHILNIFSYFCYEECQMCIIFVEA